MPKSGQFLVSELEAYATTTFNIFGCGTCGLLWLGTPPLGEIDYTAVSRGTGAQLPKYKDELIRRIAGHAGADGLVVEVGANDGSFARLLLESKIGRAVVAIEPSHAFIRNYAGSGVHVVTDYLTERTAADIRRTHGMASVVVCRHTLEHVPEPGTFVRAMHSLLRDERSLLMVEVPNTASLVRNVAVHELWDQHLYYFSEKNARALLAHNGLHVFDSRIYPHLGSENLVIYARRQDVAAPSDIISAKPDFDLRSLGLRIEQLVTELNGRAAEWRKPVAALGASHPQTNFLSITGVAPFVDCLVDDDRNKQGKYAPVAKRPPLPIFSTEETLGQVNPSTILLTGFGYPDWIARVKDRFAGRDVRFVDPYPAAPPGIR